MRAVLTSTVLALGLVTVLAACTGDASEPEATTTAAPAGTVDAGPPLTVEPRAAAADDEQVEVGGVRIDVPAGLEVRPASDGVSQKVGLHEPGRERAVLVLSVTEESDGVTDADVDLSRDVFEHQLTAAGAGQELTSVPVSWSVFEHAVGVRLELVVGDEELPVTWVAGRDAAGERLVTVHVEADAGEDVESTPAYEAFRTIRLG